MNEPFIGQICLFGFNFAPRGWALCNGQLLPIAQNTALFSLLGTTYGGDGSSTFALPNLQSRVVVGQGQGPGLSSYSMGQTGGAESVTLLSTQMPSHNHQLNASNSTGATNTPTNNVLAASYGALEDGTQVTVNTYSGSANTTLSPSSIGAAGGNQPHENRQPFLTMNYCIALQGIFPSRN